MPGKPAARLGDPTQCPKKGHSPASITSGSSDVLINGLPAARIGDQTSCGSTLTGNASSSVLINGKPALTIGGTGNHGDVIIGGSGDVIIGDHFNSSALATVDNQLERSWISFTTPVAENYSGLKCKAFFADGQVLSGHFNSDNILKFSGINGATCERLEMDFTDIPSPGSVTEQLLSLIIGEPKV